MQHHLQPVKYFPEVLLLSYKMPASLNQVVPKVPSVLQSVWPAKWGLAMQQVYIIPCRFIACAT